jgi:hypothetical protein
VRACLSVSLVAIVVLVSSWPVFGQAPQKSSPEPVSRLVAPAKGHIPVAFILTEGAVMIDFAGPWEVFQDVHVESRGPSMEEQMIFELYTVSDSKRPIRVSVECRSYRTTRLTMLRSRGWW